MKGMIDPEYLDVLAFNTKFDLPMSVNKATRLLPKDMRNRLKFMNEELDELKEAVATGDMVGICDAMVDLVYVIKGTAVMMGLPWEQLWDAVHRANMAKINTGKSVDHKIGIAKPEGWVGPESDIQDILLQHGYAGDDA